MRRTRRRHRTGTSATTLRESIESNQLKQMRERGLTSPSSSPRASFMAHQHRRLNASSGLAAICNELCFRVSNEAPTPMAQVALLQSPGVDPKTASELEKMRQGAACLASTSQPHLPGGH
ncbi:MAG: hypothetical protein M5R42_09620 [Rhodocyclaceae bacterium]|nr:hypothetical protein [Rhodocyclaceae bacterium]